MTTLTPEVLRSIRAAADDFKKNAGKAFQRTLQDRNADKHIARVCIGRVRPKRPLEFYMRGERYPQIVIENGRSARAVFRLTWDGRPQSWRRT